VQSSHISLRNLAQQYATEVVKVDVDEALEELFISVHFHDPGSILLFEDVRACSLVPSLQIPLQGLTLMRTQLWQYLACEGYLCTLSAVSVVWDSGVDLCVGCPAICMLSRMHAASQPFVWWPMLLHADNSCCIIASRPCLLSSAVCTNCCVQGKVSCIGCFSTLQTYSSECLACCLSTQLSGMNLKNQPLHFA